MERFDQTILYTREGTGTTGATLSESYKNFNLIVIKYGPSTEDTVEIFTQDSTSWNNNESYSDTPIYPSSTTKLESSGTTAIKQVIGVGRIS